MLSQAALSLLASIVRRTPFVMAHVLKSSSWCEQYHTKFILSRSTLRLFVLMEINACDCGLVSIIISTRGLGMSINDYVRWFSDIRVGDVALVGGKNASLGELYSTLSKQGCVFPTALR